MQKHDVEVETADDGRVAIRCRGAVAANLTVGAPGGDAKAVWRKRPLRLELTFPRA